MGNSILAPNRWIDKLRTMKIWFCWLAIFAGMGSEILANDSSRFDFREPNLRSYRIEETAAKATPPKWLTAQVENSTNDVELGSRVVLQIEPGSNLSKILGQSPLQLARTISTDVFILQAPDAWTAVREANRLSHLRGVLVCHPVMRREVELDAAYAPMPVDQYFSRFQWYLENRNTNGSQFSADLNVRSAWPHALGNGITIAIADSGFETNHPDLVVNASGSPHFNFETDTPNGFPPTSGAIHGTSVAGLAAAAKDGVGVVGVAPGAKLASWVIIGTNSSLSSRSFVVDDESLMDMFQYQSNAVQVQNHSWGFPSRQLNSSGLLPRIGISNAVSFGRNGLGVVMVRSGGNARLDGGDANDKELTSDPQIVSVGATLFSGRVAPYSSPGACLLVSAIGGEDAFPFVTTDRQGAAGYSAFQMFSDPNFWNFTYAPSFKGTSAAAPQIAGLAALILSARPDLSYRDVQQILIHSGRHWDLADPDLVSNGAGFSVSHNVGFGIPDAGHALRLALDWPNRPAKTNLLVTLNNSTAIPDAGLRVVVSGENVPVDLLSIAAAPSLGVHADSPTPVLPLVDVGLVTNTLSVNLTNKAALIQHGTNFDYALEITRVAQAGAAFAVLFYYSDAGVPSAMLGTDFASIPAVIIGLTKGTSIRNYLQTNATGAAQIQLDSANYPFAISEMLSCEHVGVRVSLNHPFRADLRVTLISPQGTRSVLQRINGDTNAAPTDWTYWSTHHFYESSAGTWTVSVSDEFPGGTGSVQSVELIINGVAITDSDHDGLDDNWESNNFGSLAFGPKADPEKDGYNNAREQIMGTNPNAVDIPFRIDFSRWNQTVARLSWPSSTNFNYEVLTGTNVANLSVVTNLSGKFPETEWFTTYPTPALASRFFTVRALPKP